MTTREYTDERTIEFPEKGTVLPVDWRPHHRTSTRATVAGTDGRETVAVDVSVDGVVTAMGERTLLLSKDQLRL